MKILITNNSLSELAGSEIFVYELAKGLRELKHQVSIFIFKEITKDAIIPQKLKKLGVKIINNVDDLTQKYDVIHCHHNTTATLINSRYPETPKIFVSHGWVFPICVPNIDIKFNKIIAISDEVKANLIKKGFKDVEIVRNPIDTQRFKFRKFKAKELKNIVIASNHAGKPCKAIGQTCEPYETKKPQYAQIECLTDCEKKPIIQMQKIAQFYKSKLLNIGASMFLNQKGEVEVKNNQIWNIEDAYKTAELVFSIGRSALTAISMGVPTCIYDHFGYAGFIESKEQFEELERTNFSGRIPHQINNDFPILDPIVFGYKFQKNVFKLKMLSDLVKEKYSAKKVVKQYEKIYKEITS